jgi:hypothetical protein
MLRAITLGLVLSIAGPHRDASADATQEDELWATRHLVPKPRLRPPVRSDSPDSGPSPAVKAACTALDAALGPSDTPARAELLKRLSDAKTAAQVEELAQQAPGLKKMLADHAPGGDLQRWDGTSNAKQAALITDCGRLWARPGKPGAPLDDSLLVGAAAPPGAVGTTGGAGWQTAVVDGLASFVATRTEAELSMWIMQHFVTRMCAVEATRARKAWFPGACALSQRSDEGEVPGTAFISALREDIEQIPYVILRELLTRRVGEGAADGITDATRAIGGAIVAMRNGDEPADVLAGLADVHELQQQCRYYAMGGEKLGCSLAVVGEVVTTIRERDKSGRVAASAFKFTDVFENPALRERLTALYDSNPVDYEVVEKLLVPVGAFIQWTYEHRPPTSDASARLEHARLLTIQLLRLTDGVIHASYTTPPRTLDTAQDALKAADAMLRGDYGEGARKLVRLLDMLLDEHSHSHADMAKEAKKANEKPAGTDKQSSISVQQVSLFGLRRQVAKKARATQAEVERKRDALTSLRRYIVLAADLAAAKTSAEVQAAIQAAAAPVGGWRIKRQGFTVSLSALAGVHFGVEVVPKKDHGVTIAPIASVGIDLSGPVGKKGVTLGGFVSILDLGQLVSARLYSNADRKPEEGATEEKAETASEVKVVSVLSPGAYFKVGLGRSPFVFGAGAVYAPALRGYFKGPNAGVEKVETAVLSAIRIGIFLAVDVTIFPFRHTRRGSRR